MATLPDRASPSAPVTTASIANIVPAGLIWGFSFLCIKVAVQGMPPLTLTALRVTLGAVVVLATARVRHVRLPRGWTDWRLCATYTAVSTVVPFTAFAWAEQRVPSALAGVLNGAVPLFTVVIGLAVSRVAGDRRASLGVRAAVGLVLGFVGVALAARLGIGDLSGSGTLAGALACVLAAACYGVSFVYAAGRLRHLDFITITAGQLLVASAVMAPIGAGAAIIEGFHPTPTRVLAVAVLGFLGTGVAFLLNQRAISLVGPTSASLVTYIIPVVAVAAGVLLAGETFSWRLVAGGALVIGGVAISRL